jgi:hypothetical protein
VLASDAIAEEQQLAVEMEGLDDEVRTWWIASQKSFGGLVGCSMNGWWVVGLLGAWVGGMGGWSVNGSSVWVGGGGKMVGWVVNFDGDRKFLLGVKYCNDITKAPHMLERQQLAVEGLDDEVGWWVGWFAL